ncbi:uncharacterized protein KY384_008306 [Bacidia gigantensis]|uniref:uncharacterized protein n=1 Tax=Bacidia gigantensis TaxID=2732470 RepID=UPI001D03BA8B|nr:uncharacterized protein KY384_008306 [Bacidia gigantensis]KAG8526877.1 hypothetical protein KY384_008306 [Bacidia gigantensis]
MQHRPSNIQRSTFDTRVEGSLHTPSLVSPPDSRTPPTVTGKRTMDSGQAKRPERSDSEPVDPNALSRALENVGNPGQSRERTPISSPSRKRQRVYGDRFIPNRSGQDLHASYNLLNDDASPDTPSKTRRAPHGELHYQRTEESNRTYTNVLRSELFENTVPQPTPPTLSPDHNATHFGEARGHTPPTHRSSSALPPASLTPSTPHKNFFNFRNLSGHPTPSRTPGSKHTYNMNPNSDLYSTTPIRRDSQRLLLSPRKQPRAVSKVPFKVLDAPDLADDFYLNLVDWGGSNILGVGLSKSVYMWNSATGLVNKLCELQEDTVTSVSWIQRGTHLAIGTEKGLVQIWDAEKQRRLRTMTGHTARVGALAWNDHILTSGSRDRLIYHRDVRQPEMHVRKLSGHKQEVCGLKWNTEDGQLASGGNDNKLMVWDKLSEQPTWKFEDHTAAVKAIAWSPHQSRLLASGGGTADRRIRFWDTKLGQCVSELDTGSQVCNLAWSKNSNELVSTHGYSQNQIVVWKYPSMTQVASLTGHTYRVLYLAMSPDGQTVVTGAGDETLRFWKCFQKRQRDGIGGEGAGLRMESMGVIR